jgi:hypothetical protein
VLDLSGGRSGPPEPEPVDRSIATAIGVILGIVVIVILLSLLAGGGSDDESGSETPTSTTRPPTPATTLPRPASDVRPLLDDGERLDPAFDMALVGIRSNGSVVVADLATGHERVLDDRIPLAPVRWASWIGDTFVAFGLGQEAHRLAIDGSGTWEGIDTGRYSIDPYWPQGSPGLFWLWDDSASRVSNQMRFGLLRSTGPLEVLDGPVEVYFGAPVGFVGDRAVFNSPDGVYLLGPDGEPNRHSFGLVFGVAADRMVRRTCDEVLACRLVLDDPVAATVADLGPIEPRDAVLQAIPAPDGTAVAVVTQSGEELALRIIPVGALQTVTFAIGRSWEHPDMLQWSGDGNGLIWWDESSRQVRSLRWRDGDISSEPASARVTSPHSTAGYEGMFLIPMADLPAGWAVPGA